MAGLRVFVSSTCYDLSQVRAQLRLFISSLGHEPIMSDYNDILYDPKTHTHTNCVDEVSGCDIVVLLVGSRFGGTAVPEALSKIDFDVLENKSKSTEILNKREGFSVTQLEVLKAVEQGIPVYPFIERRVWHDHKLYEKNKDKDILSEIDFPSIEKKETVEFIFEFINYLRKRSHDNSVYKFTQIQDIEDALRKQWSLLLQRSLMEQRNASVSARQTESLASQFEELKTAILTTIGTPEQRTIANAVVKFRQLSSFVSSFNVTDIKSIYTQNLNWYELFKEIGIKEIISFERNNIKSKDKHMTLFIKNDHTYYTSRYSNLIIENLSDDWKDFQNLPNESRSVVFEALEHMPRSISRLVHHDESSDDLLDNLMKEANENEISISNLVIIDKKL